MSAPFLWGKSKTFRLKKRNLKKIVIRFVWLSIPLMRFILSIILFIGIFNGVTAHPHVFVETELTFVFDQSGVQKLKVVYHYNKMFTEELLDNFDENGNNQFEKEEIEEIRQKAFSNLVNFSYFIHITHGKTKIKHGEVSDFDVVLTDEGLYYSFTLNTAIPILKSPEKLKVALYEESYYIDVRYKSEGVHFEGTNFFDNKYKIFEDESQAYYFDQIYPETLILTLTKKP